MMQTLNPPPIMYKPGWIIIVGVVVLSLIAITLTFIRNRQPTARMVVEAPTVVLSPAQQATYTPPALPPKAQHIQTQLTTRAGCIDNCQAFEPLHGLGQRVTDFVVAASAQDVLAFYRRTLPEQGWRRTWASAFDYDELKQTPGLNPPPIPSHWEESYTYTRNTPAEVSLNISVSADAPHQTQVTVVEVLAEPFTWPSR